MGFENIMSKTIFISHIYEEAPLATSLKEWIESSFSGTCDVFVSSDPTDLPVGKKWLQEIDTALRSSQILIVLCSPKSILRPWINFEAGCAWIKDISIIPVCHSGLTLQTLPPPLSYFQAIELESRKFVELLIKGIASNLGLKKHPKIDVVSMQQSLKNSINSIQLSMSKFEKSEFSNITPVIFEEKMHAVLNEIVNSAQTGIYQSEILKDFSNDEARLIYYLEKLSNDGLIIGDWIEETPEGKRDEWKYRATMKGRKAIFEE